MSAVHGAAVRGKDQSSLCILVLKSCLNSVVGFAAGVEITGKISFCKGRDTHTADGIRRVVFVDQGEIVFGNRHGEPFQNNLHLFLLLIGQVQIIFDL